MQTVMIYDTKDFYFSALLLTNNFKLVQSQEGIGGVHFFFLNNNEELLKKLENDFEKCIATVPMKKFTSSLARLRRELDQYK